MKGWEETRGGLEVEGGEREEGRRMRLSQGSLGVQKCFLLAQRRRKRKRFVVHDAAIIPCCKVAQAQPALLARRAAGQQTGDGGCGQAFQQGLL